MQKRQVIITGSKGKIGKYLVNYFSNIDGYEVIKDSDDTGRLDLTDRAACEQLIKKSKNKKNTFIIHCAFKNVRYHKNFTEIDYYHSINMFDNMFEQRGNRSFINIGSWAVFSDILTREYEMNYYSMAKISIAHTLIKQYKKRSFLSKMFSRDGTVHELLVAGAFDPSEDDDRFFKSIITSLLKTNICTIKEDLTYGFISYNHLAKYIQHIIEDNVDSKTHNCFYEVRLLSEYAKIVIDLLGGDEKMCINLRKLYDVKQFNLFDMHCIDNPKRIDFKGESLEQELMKYIEEIKKELNE